jgi:putative peptide zinc metalloprotease protein
VTLEEAELAVRHVTSLIAKANQRSKEHVRRFWVRVPFIPARIVCAGSRPLTLLFHPAAVALLVCTITVAVVIILQMGLLNVNGWSSAVLWQGYGLFLLSLIVHEFGHSSACLRFGANPSAIGFGAYYIFPVFYSDVSAAWQLSRWQRVIVDLGGTFLQAIVGASYVIVYLATGWEPLHTAIVLIIASTVFSLNPILKFDGYWVIADTLGVTNLAEQPRRIVNAFVARVRGQTAHLPWPLWVIGALAVYTVLTGAFWVMVTLRVLPQLLRRVMEYPDQVKHFAILVTQSRGSEIIDHVIAFITASILVILTVLICLRLLSLALSLVTTTWLRLIQSLRKRGAYDHAK